MSSEVLRQWDVSEWTVLGAEQTGTSESRWLEEPGTRYRWLHKDTVIPQNGVEQGEDWSEVVSTQVAMALGVPCATTRMCVRHGRRGSISLDVVARGYSLYPGATALELAAAPGYFPHREGEPGCDPARPTVRRPGHTPTNIKSALEGVEAPPGFEGPESLTGFDVFCGYLMLDALIANRDRHEENWAVLIPLLRSDPPRLSPSYDHASSLGYNEQDSREGTAHRNRAGSGSGPNGARRGDSNMLAGRRVWWHTRSQRSPSVRARGQTGGVRACVTWISSRCSAPSGTGRSCRCRTRRLRLLMTC